MISSETVPACTGPTLTPEKYCGMGSQMTVYLPHITGGFDDWTDYLHADNLSDSKVDYTLTLFGSGGTEIYSNTLSVNGLSKSVIDIKALTAAANNALTGKITYTEPQLNFRLSYLHTIGGGVAQFQLTDTLSSKLGLFFSDFMPSLSAKGLALANFGTASAAITLEAIGNGVINGKVTVNVGPNEKYLATYQSAFPGLDISQVETIRATSTSSTFAGLVITAESDNGFLLFTPAIPID